MSVDAVFTLMAEERRAFSKTARRLSELEAENESLRHHLAVAATMLEQVPKSLGHEFDVRTFRAALEASHERD